MIERDRQDELPCVFVESGVIDQLQSMRVPAASWWRRAAFGAPFVRGRRNFFCCVGPVAPSV